MPNQGALDSEDIEGLFALGAPTDEYETEASLMEGRISKVADLRQKTSEVEALVAEVWNAQFGPFDADELRKRQPAFYSVARRIASKL